MTTDQMRNRALERKDLRGMLAVYRYNNDREGYPALLAQKRAIEAPEVKYQILCGKDEAESERIANDLVNTRGFKQFLHRNGATYEIAQKQKCAVVIITIL